MGEGRDAAPRRCSPAPSPTARPPRLRARVYLRTAPIRPRSLGIEAGVHHIAPPRPAARLTSSLRQGPPRPSQRRLPGVPPGCPVRKAGERCWPGGYDTGYRRHGVAFVNVTQVTGRVRAVGRFRKILIGCAAAHCASLNAGHAAGLHAVQRAQEVDGTFKILRAVAPCWLCFVEQSCSKLVAGFESLKPEAALSTYAASDSFATADAASRNWPTQKEFVDKASKLRPGPAPTGWQKPTCPLGCSEVVARHCQPASTAGR
jgi:hypothetical protein